MTPHEQRLITKEHIVHIQISLYSSSSIELKFLLKHYRLVFFYKLRNLHGTPTFKTKVFRLISSVV